MKLISLFLEFFGNLIYLVHMTFVERRDVDFEFLPFGNTELKDSH